MSSIHFYHLTTTPLERALPKLLEKSYGGGFRTIVVARDREQVERLNQLLWTYDPDSFLPHGTDGESHADAHPILLTATIPAQAGEKEMLFLTNGDQCPDPARYERVIDMFDGGNEESLQAARSRWKQYKETGCELIYLKQNEKGGWSQAAA